MKIKKISDHKESFKPYKIIIEILVETFDEKRTIDILKQHSNDICIANEDYEAPADTDMLSRHENEIADNLIQNIISNL